MKTGAALGIATCPRCGSRFPGTEALCPYCHTYHEPDTPSPPRPPDRVTMVLAVSVGLAAVLVGVLGLWLGSEEALAWTLLAAAPGVLLLVRFVRRHS